MNLQIGSILKFSLKIIICQIIIVGPPIIDCSPFHLLLHELTGIIFQALIEVYLTEADRAAFADQLLVNRKRREYATEEELSESEPESEN